MRKMLLGLAAATALALPLTALAQQKIEVPKDTFYAALGPTQYLVKSRLIGAAVVDKAGGKLGSVDDVILGTKDDKVDGLLVDAGGGKKIGVRMSAAKVDTKDGKTTITLPAVTAEMLKVLPAYGAKK